MLLCMLLLSPSHAAMGAVQGSLPAAEDGPDRYRLSPRAAGLAHALKVDEDIRRLEALSEESAKAGVASQEGQALRRRLLEKIVQAYLEIRCVYAKIQGEIARDNDQTLRVNDRANRAVDTINTSNFLGRGTLGIIGSANRIASLSLVGNLLQLLGSSVSVSFSSLSLYKARGPRLPAAYRPNMLAKVLGLPCPKDVEYPEALWTFLNLVPPGKRETRRDALIALWRGQGILRDKPGGPHDPAALAGINPGVKVTRKLLNYRVAMLNDLMARVVEENVNLLELLTAIPDLPPEAMPPANVGPRRVVAVVPGVSPRAAQLVDILQAEHNENAQRLAPLSDRAAHMAAILGVGSAVDELRKRMLDRRTAPPDMAEQALRKRVIGRIVASLLEEHSVWSRIEAERTLLSDRVRITSGRTRKHVRLINASNFTEKGTLGGTGSSLNMAGLSFAGNSLQLYGGALSVALALVSYRTMKGPKLALKPEESMLAKVLGFPVSTPEADYQQTVWQFLNDLPPGQDRSRRLELLDRWTRRRYISLAGNTDERMKALAGLPVRHKVSTRFLANKAEMLNDLGAKVIEQELDLHELYRAIVRP